MPLAAAAMMESTCGCGLHRDEDSWTHETSLAPDLAATTVHEMETVMRIIFLLAITLVAGIAGFFAGGYTYNLGHPARPAPTGVGRGSPFGGLQASERAVGNALDRL